ncbi:MAG: hypothetical protein KGJ98_07225 [Chloroflexota bacterium]|nr:hypothetical protein [Chloroflexota bacterium]
MTDAATSVVYVRPGDIVVVGTKDAAPPGERRSLLSESGSVQLRAQTSSSELTLVATVAHLPIGIAYALFAPFPWQVRRAADAATVPEMLLWYVALAAAMAVGIRDRDRWPLRVGTVAFVLGVLFLFTLVEGNYGTLYRHRVMIIPSVFVLSAPMFVAIGASLRRVLPRSETAAHEPSPVRS